MKKAILTTTSGWDLSRFTSCFGFNISATQPDDTDIRFIFQIDDSLWYFHDGELVQYEFEGNIDDILLNGNTVADLLGLKGIIEFVQKRVFPIIAICAEDHVEIMPKIKVSLNVSSYRDEYIKDEFSPIFKLDTDSTARITNLSCNSIATGYSRATSQVRLMNQFGNWSDWLSFNDAINQTACAVQFKNHYIVTTFDGSEEAKLFDFNLAYTTDSSNSAADSLSIFLKDFVTDYNPDICYVLVKHSDLTDCSLKVFAKFQSLPFTRENLVIGKGIGAAKKYYLGSNGNLDLDVDPSTLKICADGLPVTDFSFDTKQATVTLTADSDATITASYSYNLDPESWVELPPASNNRFIYRNPIQNRRITSVMIELQRQSGVVNETLGTATGKLQTFTLDKRAITESISCTGISHYNPSTRTLDVQAGIDEQINVRYNWVGEFPSIYLVAAGWSADTQWR